jgi:flagellar protein FliJ
VARDARKLDRLLRVRTLQLDQVRAAEGHARARFEPEEQLSRRIAGLAANVAPVVAAAPAAATALAAAAHYRDRLHQSAQAAERRVAMAEQGLDAARERTQAARRDQNAIEKLIERARSEAALKALRAMEALPPGAARNRHDPC